MHWMAEGLSHLCRIQGVPLPTRPVFPGSASTSGPAAPNNDEVDPDAPDDDDAADTMDDWSFLLPHPLDSNMPHASGRVPLSLLYFLFNCFIFLSLRTMPQLVWGSLCVCVCLCECFVSVWVCVSMCLWVFVKNIYIKKMLVIICLKFIKFQLVSLHW